MGCALSELRGGRVLTKGTKGHSMRSPHYSKINVEAIHTLTFRRALEVLTEHTQTPTDKQIFLDIHHGFSQRIWTWRREGYMIKNNELLRVLLQGTSHGSSQDRVPGFEF